MTKAAATQAVKIAAESVEALRECDVFRVLEWNAAVRAKLAAFLAKARPELAGEIAECLAELA